MNARLPGHFRSGLIPALALAFLALVPAASLAASGSIGPEILGVEWRTIPASPCAGEEVSLRFDVCECAVDLVGAAREADGPIVVRLRVQPDIVCVTCNPDSAIVPLGRLPGGVFGFTVRIDIDYLTPPQSTTWPMSPAYGRVGFEVAPTCPGPSDVPYLGHVVIGKAAPCLGCLPRVCANDSIDVELGGTFPDNCTWFSGVSLEPSLLASPLPQPPTIRLQYEQASCLGRPCVLGPVRWSARVRLPGLPAMVDRVVKLPVEAWLRDVCTRADSLGEFLGRATFPFVVAESCSTQVPPIDGCFAVRWSPVAPGADGADARRGCNAYYGPGQGASLDFGIGAQRAISGVQGRLTIDGDGALAIKDIVASRPGWQVARAPHPAGGVGFVIFAGPGAEPIPASPSILPASLFTVRVEPTRGDLPDHVFLAALDLLVSDPQGISIAACPVLATALYPPPNVAILCREPGKCDANGDGASDVRDLVTMLNCFAPPPSVYFICPDPTGETFDCDQDGKFDLADVFCCARLMLGTRGSGNATPGREEPAIVVNFGLPRPLDGGELEVPLHLAGMAGVAAARVDLAYPDARYEVMGVTFDAAPAAWWTMSEITPGRIGLAVLDLSGMEAGSPTASGGEVTLRLRLRPGATAGGELAVAATEFAGMDGAGLSTPNAAARLELAAIGRVSLSGARPNPFGATTSFALTLPIEDAVDAAVYDAAGRRVATLMRETRAAAGVYLLRWDGADTAGARAAGGVYFVRVVTGAGTASSKVLFLPGGVR